MIQNINILFGNETNKVTTSTIIPVKLKFKISLKHTYTAIYSIGDQFKIELGYLSKIPMKEMLYELKSRLDYNEFIDFHYTTHRIEYDPQTKIYKHFGCSLAPSNRCHNDSFTIKLDASSRKSIANSWKKLADLYYIKNEPYTPYNRIKSWSKIKEK